mgnify:CR=1 FL=1
MTQAQTAVPGSSADDEDAPPVLPVVEPPPPDPTRPPLPRERPAEQTAALTNMVLRPVGAGVFEIGTVRLDQKARTVTFPAVVNARGGPMEYLIVTPYGSTHESVLRTEAEPYQIHIAMLLLGARGQTHSPGGANGELPPASRIVDPWTRPITGDRVGLEVAWDGDSGSRRCPAEQWVFNLATGAPMSPGPWVYNGSLVHRGIFRAQVDGAVAALIGCPSALVNNPRRGSDNDDVWTVNTNALPAMGTAVTVTLRLEGSPPGPSEK